MGRDASLYVRRAVVKALKADAAVAAIVGARVKGPNAGAAPAFPFIRYAPAIVTPFRATGMDGSKVAMTLHAFARGEDESTVSTLAAAVVGALDGRTLQLPDCPFPAKLHGIQWASTNTMPDSDEPSAYHAVINLEAEVVS